MALQQRFAWTEHLDVDAQVAVLRTWGPLVAVRTPAQVPQHEGVLGLKAGELSARRAAAAADPAHAQLLAWPGLLAIA